MTKEFKLTAGCEGIAIFSPGILNRFVQEHYIHTKNLLDHFTYYEHHGKPAIEEGIVTAIYRIPKEEYRILVTEKTGNKNIPDNRRLFTYDFPLQVETKVVIEDISSIMNWNVEEWINFEQSTPDAGTAESISLESGNYLLRISGFNSGTQHSANNHGYLLEFIKIKDFSFFIWDEKFLDSLNYNILPEKKIKPSGSLPEKTLFNYIPLLKGKPEEHFDGELYTLENVRINMLHPHDEIETYNKLGPFRTGTKTDEVLKAIEGKKYTSSSRLFIEIQVEDMEYEGIRWDLTFLKFRFGRLYGVEFLKADFPGKFTPHLNRLREKHTEELLLQKLPSGKYKYQTIYDERSKLSPFFSIGGETTTHIYITDNDGTGLKVPDGSGRYWHEYRFSDLRVTGNYFATKKKKEYRSYRI